MRVCIDTANRVVAWNLDGTEPEVPAGCTLVEVNSVPLLRGPLYFTGTQVVPATASAGDFMKALIETGVYDAVDAAVNSMTGNSGKLAKVLWTRAAVIERDNPFVVQIATALGVNLDDLFILANSYN